MMAMQASLPQDDVSYTHSHGYNVSCRQGVDRELEGSRFVI
jgi:hypothetical protein